MITWDMQLPAAGEEFIHFTLRPPAGEPIALAALVQRASEWVNGHCDRMYAQHFPSGADLQGVFFTRMGAGVWVGGSVPGLSGEVGAGFSVALAGAVKAAGMAVPAVIQG